MSEEKKSFEAKLQDVQEIITRIEEESSPGGFGETVRGGHENPLRAG